MDIVINPQNYAVTTTYKNGKFRSKISCNGLPTGGDMIIPEYKKICRSISSAQRELMKENSLEEMTAKFKLPAPEVHII